MPDLRMPNLNHVECAGHLTRDPELKYLASGTAICSFGIAMDTGTKDNPRTAFVHCVAWQKAAEYVGTNINKGDPVLIEGRLDTESWDARDGEKKSRTQVVCSRVQRLSWPEGSKKPAGSIEPPNRQTEMPIPDDDIPF